MAQSRDMGMKSLVRIWPFVAQYKAHIAGALAALLLTSLVTLALGQGVRMVIDNGVLSGSTAMLNQTMAVIMMLVVLMSFGTFVRFYLMTWLGAHGLICPGPLRSIAPQAV